MKIDPYYQRQKCRPLSLVSGDRYLCRYLQGFSGEGASNDSGVIENVDLQGFWTLRLRHLRKWGQHYYIVLLSPLSPFHLSQKYMSLNDPDGLVGVKFCLRAGLAGWDRATSDNNCMKSNKDRLKLSAVQISGMESSFWRYKVCADIRSGSLERRR